MHNTVHTILNEILDALGVTHKGIQKSELAGQHIFSIQIDGDARTLIGAHGDTVHALDMLVKRLAEKRLDDARRATHNTSEPKEPLVSANESRVESPDTSGIESPAASAVEWRFLIDVNDYRAKQIRDLQMKALMMAERARSFQYDVELTPMSAYERLIIHTTLQDSPNVKTESQGEGRNRRVVIKYAED